MLKKEVKNTLYLVKQFGTQVMKIFAFVLNIWYIIYVMSIMKSENKEIFKAFSFSINGYYNALTI